MSRQRDRISGLNSVRYTIISRLILDFNQSKTSVVNVKLYCDMSWTPYCVFPLTENNHK